MNCPNLILGKIKMCDSDLFDGMAPNLAELNKFCESGEYHLCPFYLGSKKLLEQSKIAGSVSDWNVFHRELVDF
jgi:hypothetical protein